MKVFAWAALVSIPSCGNDIQPNLAFLSPKTRQKTGFAGATCVTHFRCGELIQPQTPFGFIGSQCFQIGYNQLTAIEDAA